VNFVGNLANLKSFWISVFPITRLRFSCGTDQFFWEYILLPLYFLKKLEYNFSQMSIFETVGSFFSSIWTKDVSASFVTPRTFPEYRITNFDTMLRYGWQGSDLVYAAIHRIASTAAQVSIKSDPDQADALQVFRKPNQFMGESDLWYLTIVFQKLAGYALFEKIRSRAGRVVGLAPIRPDIVQIHFQADGTIDHFLITPSGVVDSNAVRLAPQDVLFIPIPDPSGIVPAVPPARVAAKLLDTDADITGYLKSYFQDGAMPIGILKTKNRLTETQVESIRSRWKEQYGGWRSWNVPAILDADAEYQKISANMNEIPFDSFDARIESRVCAVLGIPPVILGLKVGLDRSTFSNYAEARRTWWEDMLIPMYESMLDNLQNQIGDELGVRLIWDYTKIPALRESEEQKFARIQKAYESGAITRNELRQFLGFEAVPNGDVFMLPSGVMEESARLKSLVRKEAISITDPAVQDKKLRQHEEEVAQRVDKLFNSFKNRVEQRAKERYGRSDV